MPSARVRNGLRVLSGLAAYPLVGMFLFSWAYILFSEPASMGLRSIPRPVSIAVFVLAVAIPSALVILAERRGWAILHDTVACLAAVLLIGMLVPWLGSTGELGGFSRVDQAAWMLVVMAAALVAPYGRRMLYRTVSP